MVEFHSIGKDYADLTALNDVSFSIPKGGIIGLLGPNGAGKTTALRIMTGFMQPTRGTVSITGRPFSPDSVQLKRLIGYLPESAPVYGEMLAWDYLSYEAKLHGLDPQQRVPEVIAEVGLQSHAHKPIRELSKGYRQRVGLAHTLLHDPELLVLDEPTNGLDPNQILEVRNLIRRIAETKTVILSTHIMQEVEALCKRVIVIHKGSIRYDGSIASFSPASRRVHLLTDGVDLDTLREALQKLPGFRTVEQNTAPADPQAHTEAAALLHTTVLTDPEYDIRPDIFHAASSLKNLTIYEMYQEKTSMEDIFHELTGDGSAAEGGPQ